MAKILLADPSASSRVVIMPLLEGAGHHVDEKPNGNDALDACRSASPPHCLILELVLQGIDGFKVMRALQEEKIDIPVIVVTDVRMKELKERCESLGAKAFVKKPVMPDTLRQTVHDVLMERWGAKVFDK